MVNLAHKNHLKTLINQTPAKLWHEQCGSVIFPEMVKFKESMLPTFRAFLSDRTINPPEEITSNVTDETQQFFLDLLESPTQRKTLLSLNDNALLATLSKIWKVKSYPVTPFSRIRRQIREHARAVLSNGWPPHQPPIPETIVNASGQLREKHVGIALGCFWAREINRNIVKQHHPTSTTSVKLSAEWLWSHYFGYTFTGEAELESVVDLSMQSPESANALMFDSRYLVSAILNELPEKERVLLCNIALSKGRTEILNTMNISSSAYDRYLKSLIAKLGELNACKLRLEFDEMSLVFRAIGGVNTNGQKSEEYMRGASVDLNTSEDDVSVPEDTPLMGYRDHHQIPPHGFTNRNEIHDVMSLFANNEMDDVTIGAKEAVASVQPENNGIPLHTNYPEDWVRKELLKLFGKIDSIKK